MNPESNNPNPQPAEQPATSTPQTVLSTAEQPAPTPVALPNAPTQWEGAFGAYKYSKAAVRRNLAAVIVMLILSSLSGYTGSDDRPLISLVFTVLAIIGSLGIVQATLAAVRSQETGLGSAFKKTLNPMLLLKFIGLWILVLLSIIGGLILLIVPGLIILARLTLAEYYLVDKNMGIIEAYKASWAATKGHALKVWGIIGATIAMMLLMLTIIGIPFSIYFLVMYGAAYAVFYEFILKQQSSAPAPAAPQPPVPAQTTPQV